MTEESGEIFRNPLLNPSPSPGTWDETNQAGRLRELLDDS